MLKDRAREGVFARLADIGITDLRSRVIFEEAMEPLRYQSEFNLAKGSAFGLNHQFSQIGYMRPHNRHSRYGNLYFAGASTHPGTGVPLVMLSAKLAAERIAREQAESIGRHDHRRRALGEQPAAPSPPGGGRAASAAGLPGGR